MLSFFTLCLLATQGLALPVEERGLLGNLVGGNSLTGKLLNKSLFKGPSVTINDGKVEGSSLLGVESFKGIPYAQPPVGDLRLKKPQPIDSHLGTIDATTLFPNACPQFYTQVHSDKLLSNVLGTVLNTPLFQKVTKQNEDCLTVNVQRPSGVDSSAKLPVVFWIYGGGYNIGATQLYDGSSIVRRSKRNGEPVIFVAVNYR
jgi:carboxylesterase type B